MALQLLIYFTVITGLKNQKSLVKSYFLASANILKICIKYSNLRRFMTSPYLWLDNFKTLIVNDSIFKLNTTAPVQIPGIRGLFRKIYFKMRSKNSSLYHFISKWSCRSRHHLKLCFLVIRPTGVANRSNDDCVSAFLGPV